MSNRIQTFSFLELLSHRFENRFQYDIPKWIYVLNIFKFIESFFIPVFLFLFSTIFSYTLWALIHECVHGNFSNSRNENRFWGRFLCILFGTPFQVVKTAHLVHHKFNRSQGERIEYIEKKRWSDFISKTSILRQTFYGNVFLRSIRRFSFKFTSFFYLAHYRKIFF
ncbi:fatty acid desaturase [Leptospira interrogans serovar Hardjo-prajitno]|uniref:fatty acid desaturase n=1 Tax=Leptospira interrogans TaxID=173 RepID=UPI003CE7E8A4